MTSNQALTIEDIVAQEVKRATLAQMQQIQPTTGEAPGGAGGGILSNLSLQDITQLLQEVGKIMQMRQQTGGDASSGISDVGIPGTDNTPAQNPTPTKPNLSAEQVFSKILNVIDQLLLGIGDVKISEAKNLMESNKPVVIGLIQQELNDL